MVIVLWPDTLSTTTKTVIWDRPGIQLDRATFETSLTSAFQQASYLAATSRHSGDWLFALPIVSCGLKLDDDAVRVAVGLCLGLNIHKINASGCSRMAVYATTFSDELTIDAN